MSLEPKETEDVYTVVVNDEEQYSIWPYSREMPLGWSSTGFQGTRTECHARVEATWTDMRPVSVRQSMDQ